MEAEMELRDNTLHIAEVWHNRTEHHATGEPMEFIGTSQFTVQRHSYICSSSRGTQC